MAVQQGIALTISGVKQSALGTAGSTGSQYIRRTSAVFQAQADTYENNEIITHQQGTGVTYGTSRAMGKIDGVLSPGAYSKFFQSLLRRDFAAVSAIASLSLTIAGSGPTYTVTRATGDFLTGGIKIGDIVRLSVGSLNAANISKNLVVVGVTATVLTVYPLNGVAMVAEGPIATCTVTVTGKKTYVPTTGHTNDYWSFENKFGTLTRYELFADMQFAQAAVSIPANNSPTVSFDLVGRSRTLSASETLTSPTAAATGSVLQGSTGFVVVDGTKAVNITSCEFTINGNTANLDPVVGSTTVPDNQRGRVTVSGTFSAYFDAVTWQTIFDNRTTTSLVVVLTDSSSATADFVTFVMSKIKITSDTPDDGEKAIVRQYAFTAEYNGSGGTSLANDATIISTQDSQAA